MHPLIISEVAAPYTMLSGVTKSGRRFGRCPFCHGKTETFSVNDRNNTFFCYACGVWGGIKELYALLNGKQAGLNNGCSGSNGSNDIGSSCCNGDAVSIMERQTMLSIYETAARFYYSALTERKNPGAAYLSKRGITKDTVTGFGLGYAPEGGRALCQSLLGMYSLESLVMSGLVRIGKNGEPYDFFRNRVMFPVFNRNGDVVAFGGRALDETQPKYINSAESQIFSKRKNLYGYPYATAAVMRKKQLIICEGYMDLIAIQEAGFADSAAVLGTALTKEHAEIIAADYSEVCLSLDSDEAGIHAAKQSAGVLVQYGLRVTVPDYKPFKDPDEFIRKAGMRAFSERLEKALPADVFCARHAKDISELADIMTAHFLGNRPVKTASETCLPSAV